MKKNLAVLGAALFLILLSPLVRGGADEEKVKSYISQYGWEISDTAEKVQIKIPDPLDNVYRKYNSLQKQSGFDLEKYKGKKAVRYTYEVLNHKFGEGVYVNILMCDGAIIGADIMTRALDGFMHGIGRREYINEAG